MKPKSPCGTEPAYQRHRRDREPIDIACANAHAQYNDDRRKAAERRAVLLEAVTAYDRRTRREAS